MKHKGKIDEGEEQDDLGNPGVFEKGTRIQLHQPPKTTRELRLLVQDHFSPSVILCLHVIIQRVTIHLTLFKERQNRCRSRSVQVSEVPTRLHVRNGWQVNRDSARHAIIETAEGAVGRAQHPQ